MSLHRALVHAVYDPACFGCRASTVQVGARQHGQERDYRFQQGFAAEFGNGDREAYRRLRQNGLQPPRIAGSAHLERHAETRFEVETGAVTDNRKALSAALGIAADHGFDPLKANTRPKE